MALIPKGGNDRVYTPPKLARTICEHFKPTGRLLEPCKGEGSFISYPGDWRWCEVDEGSDFLEYSERADWIVTNPPWSQLRSFLRHSMELADNIVFLCLINAFWMKARLRDIEQAGFGIKEILRVPQPAKPWPQTGMELGATYLQKGYSGPIMLASLKT